jgi:hypothetical protein
MDAFPRGGASSDHLSQLELRDANAKAERDLKREMRTAATTTTTTTTSTSNGQGKKQQKKNKSLNGSSSAANVASALDNDEPMLFKQSVNDDNDHVDNEGFKKKQNQKKKRKGGNDHDDDDDAGDETSSAAAVGTGKHQNKKNKKQKVDSLSTTTTAPYTLSFKVKTKTLLTLVYFCLFVCWETAVKITHQLYLQKKNPRFPTNYNNKSFLDFNVVLIASCRRNASPWYHQGNQRSRFGRFVT